jgi:cytochrome c oxidase cbb3-type subunit 4
MNELSTVVMFIAFVAIVAWAWSNKRKASFDEAARAPLEEDDGETTAARADCRAAADNKVDA